MGLRSWKGGSACVVHVEHLEAEFQDSCSLLILAGALDVGAVTVRFRHRKSTGNPLRNAQGSPVPRPVGLRSSFSPECSE